jgi:antitoxin VapB
MKYHAKLFQNGGSQAVRLPKEFRFEDQQEVLVHREGKKVILEPLDDWPDAFRQCLSSWDETLERPPQPTLLELRDPFE